MHSVIYITVHAESMSSLDNDKKKKIILELNGPTELYYSVIHTDISVLLIRSAKFMSNPEKL